MFSTIPVNAEKLYEEKKKHFSMSQTIGSLQSSGYLKEDDEVKDGGSEAK